MTPQDFDPTDISFETVRKIVRKVSRLIGSDVREALQLAELAVSISLQLNDPFAKAYALRAKGAALYSVDEHVRAIEYFDEALKVFDSLGDEFEAVKTRMNRLNAYGKLSRFDEALAEADRITGTLQRLGKDEQLSHHLVNIGSLIYFRLDRFREQLDLLDRAEPIMKRLNDTRSLCQLYLNRAVTLTSLNRAPEALKYYALAKELAAQSDMPVKAAMCDYNVCYLYFLQGQYTKALELLRGVRDRMQAVGDRYHSALCDLDQSEIYLELNMHQDAIELAERAFKAFEPLGLRYEMAKAVAFMGIAENHLHNYGKALQLFDRARKMYRDQKNEVWLSLIDLYQGIVYFQTGRYFEGLELERSAYRFFEKAGLRTKAIYARLLVARLNLQLGRLQEAWSEATGAMGMRDESASPWLGYQIHYVIGCIQAERNDVEDARRSFRSAVDELELLRTNIHVDELRMTFLKDKLRVYESLVRSGLDIGKPESLRESFGAVERAKSRTLVDLLANNINAVPANKDSDSPLVDRLRTIREELNWYYTRISLEEQKGASVASRSVQALVEEVRTREDQLIRLLRQVPSEPSGYFTLQRVTTSSLEEIQAILPEDAILVEYYVVDDRVLVFLVTHDGFEVLQNIAECASLKTSFELLRFQLSKFVFGQGYIEKFHAKLLDATHQHLHELYSELIQPLEPFLAGRKSVVLVPHDFLHYIPFHALFDGHEYFIDRFEVSYAPSASIYRTCVQGRGNRGEMPLILGVPDERTPYIRDEVQGIAKVFQRTHILMDAEATSSRLTELARHASIIHIASHGSFRRDNPMFSSIELGDTWLSLFDIYNLQTSANLVTLSGCGTGMSSVIAGDELLGLVRGFLYAGARSLVVSLWDVHDRATADIMTAFYKEIAGGKSISASLRSAILDQRTRHPHPYYWAPFIVIGNPIGVALHNESLFAM